MGVIHLEGMHTTYTVIGTAAELVASLGTKSMLLHITSLEVLFLLLLQTRTQPHPGCCSSRLFLVDPFRTVR
jgi:hypothetical protein